MVFNRVDNYHLALKAFLINGDKVLVCKDIAGKWDLPGGRVGPDEFSTGLNEILHREIEEELGKDVKYKNFGIACVFRHRRPEIINKRPEVRIVMIGFELEYEGGDIKLSDEHTEFGWHTLEEAEAMLDGGHKDGMKKYRKYLEAGKKKIIY